MGEKPMGVPATEVEDDQPPGASISTTRSNIRSGGAAVAPGDPVPDVDVKIGK